MGSQRVQRAWFAITIYCMCAYVKPHIWHVCRILITGTPGHWYVEIEITDLKGGGERLGISAVAMRVPHSTYVAQAISS
jgi:hypothetical protein